MFALGQQERDWKRDVRVQKVVRYSQVCSVQPEGAGGSMWVFYNTSTPGHAVAFAKFLHSEGPGNSHVLFSLVYQLDRLLAVS
jgi:hypothetical protein